MGKDRYLHKNNVLGEMKSMLRNATSSITFAYEQMCYTTTTQRCYKKLRTKLLEFLES